MTLSRPVITHQIKDSCEALAQLGIIHSNDLDMESTIKDAILSLDDIPKHKAVILRLAKCHGAFNVRVFGSVARGLSKPTSDVDFLVDMEEKRSLFDLGGLQHDLCDLLGVDVDLLTERGLHWFVRDEVMKEAVHLDI